MGQNTSVRFKLGLDTRFVNKWSDQPEKIFQTVIELAPVQKIIAYQLIDNFK